MTQQLILTQLRSTHGNMAHPMRSLTSGPTLEEHHGLTDRRPITSRRN